MTFKQLLQAEAIDVCQIDACRVAGVSEILSILLMAAKSVRSISHTSLTNDDNLRFGVIVCPHAGGVGLCEHTIHLSLIDYIAVSGSMERNVLEYVLSAQELIEISDLTIITPQGKYVLLRPGHR